MMDRSPKKAPAPRVGPPPLSLFSCVVAKRSLRRSGPLTLHSADPASHSSAIVFTEPPGRRGQRVCHPLEVQQRHHLPFLHAALEAFTSCEATRHTSWATKRAADAFQV